MHLRSIGIAGSLAVIAFMALVNVSCSQRQPLAVVTLGEKPTAIINGKKATGLEPWAPAIVGIAEKSGDKYLIYCTGSLLDEDTVLTAAHCLDDSSPAYLIFGLSEQATTITARKVAQQIRHEQFSEEIDEDTVDAFDIGLMHFEDGIPQGYTPARIIEDDDLLQAGEKVLVAGYGVTNSRSQSGAGTLRSTTIMITDAFFGKTEVSTDETRSGTCSGDSGGPAMIEHDGVIFLWGITSRGDTRCARQGVYTRVTAYTDWIASHQ